MTKLSGNIKGIMQKTKIVCTIGPASEEKEVLEAMIRNGMNVARECFTRITQRSFGEDYLASKIISQARQTGGNSS